MWEHNFRRNIRETTTRSLPAVPRPGDQGTSEDSGEGVVLGVSECVTFFQAVPDSVKNVVTSPTEDVAEGEGSSGEAAAVPVISPASGTPPSACVALARMAKDRER